jgi:hypothetical protein
MGMRPFSLDFYKLVVLGIVVFGVFFYIKSIQVIPIFGIQGDLILTVGFGITYSYSIYKFGISRDFSYWVKKSKEKIFQIIKTGI